jgi:RNA-directed DNA polymerase
MEEVVSRDNAKAALKRVRKNKGSAGVDGMKVDELPAYLVANWEKLRERLLAGTYQPSPVREHEIPKKDGGVRKLGIPTVLDRFVQQLILNVLQPRFDASFSEHSYGFRPGRNAHDAVCAAQQYIQSGKRWVVDVDLEKFFDRVNHDVLMGKLAKRIADKRMLKVIRRYLEAGMMRFGVETERYEGTPQGGPLSPLLANVLLDEVDKELEKRALSFARYADDCNVYVASRRAAEDAMQTLRRLYAKLKLRVNEAKSAVARPRDRKFLGYSFFVAKGREVKRKVAPPKLDEMKERVREITARSGGSSIATVLHELQEYLSGWKEYFKLAQTPTLLAELDGWIRRRVRLVQLKKWKTGKTAFRELRKRGVPHVVAARAASHVQRWWLTSKHMAMNMAMPESFFDRAGLVRLAA